MSGDTSNGKSMIYASALAVGVVVFVLFLVTFDFRFLASLFWGVIAGLLALFLLLRRHGGATAAPAKPLPPQAPVIREPAPAPKVPAAAPSDAPPAPEATPESPAPAPRADVDTPVPAPPAAPGTPETTVRATRELPGQAEVSSHRGSWRYEAAAEPAAQVHAADAPAATPPVGQARPARLDAPRGGQADDLKKIKGIGPKLEQMCHALGFYHFDQIAAWTEDEVAWVDANLEGFKGRVTRDEWVAQARTLAQGGETAFSKKVDKGGVY